MTNDLHGATSGADAARATLMGRIQKQFRADELKQLSVPEWGDAGGAFDIYFRPVTLSDMAAMNHPSAADRRTQFDKALWLVLSKACDKTGAPLFAEKDRQEDRQVLLWQADPFVIHRIAMQMLGAIAPDPAPTAAT